MASVEAREPYWRGKETPDFLAGYEIDLRTALDRAAFR
jgi:hypothetical protein